MKTLQDVIKAVRSLHQYTEYFHLSPCGGCGLPSWQEPCPICDWYPDRGGAYWMKEHNDRRRKQIQSNGYDEAHWLKRLKHNENIALWVLAGARKTLAWNGQQYYKGPDPKFKAEILKAESEAIHMDWPTGEELLAMYHESRESE